MFMDDVAIDSSTFYGGDLLMIERCCDAMLMLPGWRNSKGSVREWELAKKLGLPIFFTDNMKELMAYLETGEYNEIT
jgi:hypothetical protein